MKKSILLIFFVHVCVAQEIKFVEYDLDNGLHVILHKDNTNPIVAVSVSYKVGSKNEDPNRTGLAHFFEHLLFEGSEYIKRGEFIKYVSSNAGRSNANTDLDRTYYYEVMPSHKLELALWLESERLMHAKIDHKGIEIQREVVKEEKRQRENMAYSSHQAELSKRLYTKHPYRWTPIGSMEHIGAATLDEFRKFYKHFYVPNNAVLTIAGDIDVKKTKKLIKDYFGPIPRGKHKIYRPNIREPQRLQPTVDTVYDPLVNVPAVFTAYIAPKQTEDDFYVMQVINGILSGGKSSIFNKELMEKQQIAASASAFLVPGEDYGTFVCYGVVNGKESPKKLFGQMQNLIKRIQNQKFSDRELQKVLNNAEMGFIDSSASMAGMAEQLSDSYLFGGDTNLVNTRLKKYRKITRRDIVRVAKKYLDENKRVTLYYLPQNK